MLNVVVGPCKCRDMLRQKQVENIAKALEIGYFSSGQGLNQESSLKRVGDARWSSHYNTLVRLSIMFDSVTDVLEIISEDSSNSNHRDEAKCLLDIMQTFEFVFFLVLLRRILAITNDLSQALQRKDQDIVNAMNLVNISKGRLQEMRENGWSFLLDEVTSFVKNMVLVFLIWMIPLWFEGEKGETRWKQRTCIITESRYSIPFSICKCKNLMLGLV